MTSTLLKTLAYIGLVAGTSSSAMPADENVYRRLSRSIETFGAVFREVNSGYVDDVDPDALVQAGIEAMLKKLDPYSTYMKYDETDEIDMLSSGVYVGLGISVATRDSVLTIVDLRENGPAMQAGVRIGDVLYQLDSMRTDTMVSSSLRPYSKGRPGSIAIARLLRLGRLDTITVSIPRAELPLDAVSHKEILANNIGYLRLSRFSRGTGRAVRSALTELSATTKLRGIILDLRDNPGGLIDAAIDVVSVFVPRQSPIVATRGRDEVELHRYFSTAEPLEPALPLAVLINERSASASEIVAGAIQDLDRGIIVGARSFGKGLVQTVVSMPFDASLKLTTSRYYTPSGRSIQRIDYKAKRGGLVSVTSPEISEDSEYRTRNGRPVGALHGIDPDSIVSDSILPAPIEYLVKQNVFFAFATQYASSMDTLPNRFTVDKPLFEAFLRHVDSLSPRKRSALLADLATAIQRAQKAGWSLQATKSLEGAFRLAEREVPRVIRLYQPDVVSLLDREIRMRFGSEQTVASKALLMDPSTLVASRLLLSKHYYVILAPQVPIDH